MINQNIADQYFMINTGEERKGKDDKTLPILHTLRTTPRSPLRALSLGSSSFHSPARTGEYTEPNGQEQVPGYTQKV